MIYDKHACVRAYCANVMHLLFHFNYKTIMVILIMWASVALYLKSLADLHCVHK